MGFLSGIGNFLGGLFGGNSDEEKKKQQQRAQQQAPQKAAVAQPAAWNRPQATQDVASTPQETNSVNPVIPDQPAQFKDSVFAQTSLKKATPPPKQSLWDKAKDVVDANSAMDKYKRAEAGQPTDYAAQQKEVFGKRAITNPVVKAVNTFATPLIETFTGYGLNKQAAGELTPEEAARAALVQKNTGSVEPAPRKVAPNVYAAGDNRQLTPQQEAVNGIYAKLMGKNPLAKAGSSTPTKMAVEGGQNVISNTYSNLFGEGDKSIKDRVIASVKQAPEQFALGLPFGLIPGQGGEPNVSGKLVKADRNAAEKAISEVVGQDTARTASTAVDEVAPGVKSINPTREADAAAHEAELAAKEAERLRLAQEADAAKAPATKTATNVAQEAVSQAPQAIVPHAISEPEIQALNGLDQAAKTRVLSEEEKALRINLQDKKAAIDAANNPVDIAQSQAAPAKAAQTVERAPAVEPAAPIAAAEPSQMAKAISENPPIAAPAPAQAIDAPVNTSGVVDGAPAPAEVVNMEQVARDQANLADPTTGVEAANQTATRVLADPNVPAETKSAISNLTHEVKNDAIMINAADSLVRGDLNTARQMFDGMDLINNGLNLDGHVHLGNALTMEYNRLGMTAEAGKVYNDLISTTSRLGQGLRAAQAISKISPQGIVEFAANVADKQGRKLTPELQQELIDAATAVSGMESGPEKAAAIEEMITLAQQPTLWEKAGNFTKGLLSVPRGLMASADLSFALRQGGVLGSRYPKEWAQANMKGAKYALSSEKFNAGMKALANLTDENGDLLAPVFKKMNLALPSVAGKAEEAFGNTSILESKALKKVGVGHVVAGSDRAFSGAAAEMRANVAKKIIDGYGGIKAMSEWTSKDLEDLGKVLNTATGRGTGKDSGWFEKAAPALSDTLFSARLWKSRLDLLNPAYYARLSPAARKVALQSSASFGAVALAVLGAAAAAGASVESDPRSSDFGKIKIGNTRYDIMGGLQQNIVLAAREITGQKKNSTTGEVTDFAPGLRFGENGQPISIGSGESGFGGTNRVKVLGDFVTNKETPVLGAATRILSGKDIAGNPVNPWTEVAKLFIPLGAQDVYAGAQNAAGTDNPIGAGDVLKGAVTAAPGFVGAGVQTYGSDTTKTMPGNNADPLTLSPKELKKYQKNVDRQFEQNLTDEQKQLYNISQDSKLTALALSKGRVTQQQLDAIQSMRDQALVDAGLPADGGPSVTSEAIQARFEDGNFDSAISGLQNKLKKQEADANVSKSSRQKTQDQIKEYQVHKDGNFPPEVADLYKKTSLTEWRNMGDPESDSYNPEKYQQLWAYDSALAGSSVSRNTDNKSEQFYSAKKAGKGRGGSGSSSVKSNTIGSTPSLGKISLGNLAPQKAGGKIPTIAQVKPGELIKKRTISVKKA